MYNQTYMLLYNHLTNFVFLFFRGFETKTMDSRIEESNVGHQLLKKMGKDLFQHNLQACNGRNCASNFTSLIRILLQNKIRSVNEWPSYFNRFQQSVEDL